MTALTDYAKNLLARSLIGRQPALPTAVWVGLGTGGTDAAGLTGEPPRAPAMPACRWPSPAAARNETLRRCASASRQRPAR